VPGQARVDPDPAYTRRPANTRRNKSYRATQPCPGALASG
jgi:hypothetical protein